MLLIVISVIQFIFSLVTGANNTNLREFGDSLGRYIQQMVAFLTYNSDDKPFPFTPWPENTDSAAIDTNGIANETTAQAEEDETPPTTGS